MTWILGLVRSIGARTWGLILAAAGVALALFSVHRSGKRAGRQEEQTKALNQAVENAEIRNDVETDVLTQPDPAGELFDSWSRDKRVRVDKTYPRW